LQAGLPSALAAAARGNRQPTDPLFGVKERAAFLMDQHLAQQLTEEVDVATQGDEPRALDGSSHPTTWLPAPAAQTRRVLPLP